MVVDKGKDNVRNEDFHDLVIKTFDEISTKIDSDFILQKSLDYDARDDVLSINTGSGEYLINRNAIVQELWLSSPISGPAHFRYIDGIWVSSEGTELLTLLFCELAAQRS